MNSLCLLVWVDFNQELSFAICVKCEDTLDEEPQCEARKQEPQGGEKHCALLAGSFSEFSTIISNEYNEN